MHSNGKDTQTQEECTTILTAIVTRFGQQQFALTCTNLSQKNTLLFTQHKDTHFHLKHTKTRRFNTTKRKQQRTLNTQSTLCTLQVLISKKMQILVDSEF